MVACSRMENVWLLREQSFVAGGVLLEDAYNYKYNNMVTNEKEYGKKTKGYPNGLLPAVEFSMPKNCLN